MDVKTFKETLKEFDNTHLTDIIIHSEYYEELMRFENPTKWEIFLDGFRNFWNCLDCYNDGDEWGYDEFWEGLSLGWYMEYIYPYDDFNPTISPERKLRLDQKPPVIYVSEEAYNTLMEAINNPPDPEKVKRLREIMNKPSPWDELWWTEND